MAKKKAGMVNPRLLHDEILTLIKEEVDVIKMTGSPRYDPEVSNLLVRYSQALSAVTKDYDDQKAKAAERLGKLNSEDLKKLAKRLIDNNDLLEQGL